MLRSPRKYQPPPHSTKLFSVKAIRRNVWKLLQSALLSHFSNADICIDYDGAQLNVNVFATDKEKDEFVLCAELDDYYNEVSY